jgi:nucleoside-diphosphate-sugar epimerase
MDVFIVGGTGLISTGITRQLDDRGHDVTLFTRGETDPAVPVPVPDADRLRGDRNDTDRLSTAIREAEPDCVIDMVCFDAEQARDAVEAVAPHCDRYVFCSTVDVYHRPVARNPVTESARRYPNVSDYGRNKANAEDVFFNAHETGRLDVTVLRPWNTYGEGGSLVHTFGLGTGYLARIREGKPIVVHGDGTGLWGPCHRDDVARAFVGAVETPEAAGRAYNVTSEETATWNEYHRTVADALDAPEPELVHVPTDLLCEALPEQTRMLRDHFQYSTVFDSSRARRVLGVQYTVEFETGVRRVVDWLAEHESIDTADTGPSGAVVTAWRGASDTFLDAMDG